MKMLRDDHIDQQTRWRKWAIPVVTTVTGIAVTIGVAWYQISAVQSEAAAAEIERARGVKQIAVAIIEEHVLNGKRLEMDRLGRLVDQRRREEQISLPISVIEIVELAEFSITSSRHLPIERKEEMKPLFDAFYSEQRARAFEPLDGQMVSTPLLNEVARYIQDGKPAEALDALKRLDEAQRNEVAELNRRLKPNVFEVIAYTFSSPQRILYLTMVLVGYFVLVQLTFSMLRRYRRRPRY